jgi:hypothetical protein
MKTPHIKTIGRSPLRLGLSSSPQNWSHDTLIRYVLGSPSFRTGRVRFLAQGRKLKVKASLIQIDCKTLL